MMENTKYTKIIDDRRVIKTADKIIVVRDGLQTLNPSEELLLLDGWIKYDDYLLLENNDFNTDVTTESPEFKLNCAKANKIQEIMAYDSSDKVNIFSVQGMDMWLDYITRSKLFIRIQAEKAVGKKMTSLWFDNMCFEFKIDTLELMLMALEDYAAKCYDNTQKHVATVTNLDNIDDVNNYDYTLGYPYKLTF